MIAKEIRRDTGAKRPDENQWIRVGGHSHTIRGGTTDLGPIFDMGLAWAEKFNVNALGLGSPWSPASRERYRLYEGAKRDEYFAGKIPPESVMDREEISGLIEEFNRRSNGRTKYYIDNETPKNRFGHLWYIGFEYQVPAWHDYAQDRRVSFCDTDPDTDHNSATGHGHIRRSYAEVVWRQRKAGASAVWAHPTSWWHGSEFTTNIAADMIPELLADGFLDGMTVQGYDSYHRQYQNLWFHLLDKGWRIPGFSELDLCLGDNSVLSHTPMLNWVPLPADGFTVSQMKAELKACHHFMSSGPFVTMTVDNAQTGSSIPSGDGARHTVVLTAFPKPGQECIGTLDVVGVGGKAVATVNDFPGGTITFEVNGDDRGGYLVARAFGEGDSPEVKRHQDVKFCGVTNPVYLDAKGTPHPKALTTELTLLRDEARKFGPDGAKCRLVTAGGDPIDSFDFAESRLKLNVPAHARLELVKPNGNTRRIQLTMANREVRSLMDYLADGHFLRDHAWCEPGDVPPEAFRYDEMCDAISRLSLHI